jgi:hypothetical protein
MGLLHRLDAHRRGRVVARLDASTATRSGEAVCSMRARSWARLNGHATTTAGAEELGRGSMASIATTRVRSWGTWARWALDGHHHQRPGRLDGAEREELGSDPGRATATRSGEAVCSMRARSG